MLQRRGPGRTRQRSLLATGVAGLTVAVVLSFAGSASATTIVPVEKGPGRQVTGIWPGQPVPQTFFGGVLKVLIDGTTPAFAYCIDINHILEFGGGLQEGDFGDIPHAPEILSVLHNHPADVTNQNNDKDEAAAVQAAIWHFSDGYELQAPGSLLGTYNAIIADAIANPITTQPGPTLTITPSTQTGTAGDYLSFAVDTTATDPVPLVLSGDAGGSIVDCATHAAKTTATGPHDTFCLFRTTNGSNTVGASALAILSQGRVFGDDSNGLNPAQAIVLANSVPIQVSASASGTWGTAIVNLIPTITVPCPTGGFTFGLPTSFTAVGSGGDGALHYQWFLNGIAIAGATNPKITITLAKTDVLTVTVTDSMGANGGLPGDSASFNVSGACPGKTPPPPPPPVTPPAVLASQSSVLGNQQSQGPDNPTVLARTGSVHTLQLAELALLLLALGSLLVRYGRVNPSASTVPGEQMTEAPASSSSVRRRSPFRGRPDRLVEMAWAFVAPVPPDRRAHRHRRRRT